MSRRANESEQEYQARLAMERQREAARERDSQLLDIDRERQKQLHWMRFDKCFTCAGVYLDDGELEQLTGKPGWFDSMLRFFRN
jgi:hypothetical protein